MTKKQITGIVLVSLFNPLTIFLISAVFRWLAISTYGTEVISTGDSGEKVVDVYRALSIIISNITSLSYVLMFFFLPLGIYLLIDKNNTQSQEGEKHENYAGFWKRMAAGIIDYVSIYLIIPIFISLYTYFTRGQTLGKMAMGIKIVRADDHEKTSGGTLFGRFFAKILSYIPLHLGFYWIGWDKRKQGWHDKICNTTVVETRSYHPVWTWIANAPFLLTMIAILGTIVFISLQGYSQDARDAQRFSVINTLSTITTTNQSINNVIPQNKQEALTMITSYGVDILAPVQEDRCYFYTMNPETNEFLFFISGEKIQDNGAYKLYMAGNYPELQNHFTNNSITPGEYFSCSMQEEGLINLSL